jgi:hypothetical protein
MSTKNKETGKKKSEFVAAKYRDSYSLKETFWPTGSTLEVLIARLNDLIGFM